MVELGARGRPPPQSRQTPGLAVTRTPAPVRRRGRTHLRCARGGPRRWGPRPGQQRQDRQQAQGAQQGPLPARRRTGAPRCSGDAGPTGHGSCGFQPAVGDPGAWAAGPAGARIARGGAEAAPVTAWGGGRGQPPLKGTSWPSYCQQGGPPCLRVGGGGRGRACWVEPLGWEGWGRGGTRSPGRDRCQGFKIRQGRSFGVPNWLGLNDLWLSPQWTTPNCLHAERAREWNLHPGQPRTRPAAQPGRVLMRGAGTLREGTWQVSTGG